MVDSPLIRPYLLEGVALGGYLRFLLAIVFPGVIKSLVWIYYKPFLLLTSHDGEALFGCVEAVH